MLFGTKRAKKKESNFFSLIVQYWNYVCLPLFEDQSWVVPSSTVPEDIVNLLSDNSQTKWNTQIEKTERANSSPQPIFDTT